MRKSRRQSVTRVKIAGANGSKYQIHGQQAVKSDFSI